MATKYKLGPNDMLLHYEEYGGLDIKVTVRQYALVRYLKEVHRVPDGRARSEVRTAMRLFNGWRRWLEDDERFYEWMKDENRKTAKKRFIPERSFKVCWVSNNQYHEMTTESMNQAQSFYSEVKKSGFPAALFDRSFDGQWHSNPLKRTVLAEQVIDLFYERWLPSKVGMATDEGQCRQARGVDKCEQCLRYGVYGSVGCPFYTMAIDSRKGEQCQRQADERNSNP